MKKISTPLASIIGSLILFAGVPLLYAWTAPSATPPGGNVAAPINISTISQNKLGALGLGGLAVFGKSLFSETSGYELPLTNKPSMLVGVNGAIGAKEYCDQNGQNCVTTLGSGTSNIVSNNSSQSSSRQLLPGWPNAIRCGNGEYQSYLFIASKGMYGPGTVSYYAGNSGNGSNLGITFKYSDGSFMQIHERTTAGEKFAAAMDTCKKNIKDIPSSN